MIKFIIFLLIFNSNFSFGQNDSIKAREIYNDSFKIQKGKFIKSAKISFDSVSVKVSQYENIIETENYFEKSKTKLNIQYFIKNKTLNLVRVREDSESPNDFWLIRQFYFENIKIFYEEERAYISGRMHGIGIPRDKTIYEIYGYNKNLNSDFLKVYILQLFSKIKNYR